MLIADNSIFKSIMQYFFFNQMNSTEGVLPDDEFWKKKSFYRFYNIRKNAMLMVKSL